MTDEDYMPDFLIPSGAKVKDLLTKLQSIYSPDEMTYINCVYQHCKMSKVVAWNIVNNYGEMALYKYINDPEIMDKLERGKIQESLSSLMPHIGRITMCENEIAILATSMQYCLSVITLTQILPDVRVKIESTIQQIRNIISRNYDLNAEFEIKYGYYFDVDHILSYISYKDKIEQFYYYASNGNLDSLKVYYINPLFKCFRMEYELLKAMHNKDKREIIFIKCVEIIVNELLQFKSFNQRLSMVLNFIHKFYAELGGNYILKYINYCISNTESDWIGRLKTYANVYREFIYGRDYNIPVATVCGAVKEFLDNNHIETNKENICILSNRYSNVSKILSAAIYTVISEHNDDKYINYINSIYPAIGREISELIQCYKDNVTYFALARIIYGEAIKNIDLNNTEGIKELIENSIVFPPQPQLHLQTLFNEPQPQPKPQPKPKSQTQLPPHQPQPPHQPSRQQPKPKSQPPRIPSQQTKSPIALPQPPPYTPPHQLQPKPKPQPQQPKSLIVLPQPPPRMPSQQPPQQQQTKSPIVLPQPQYIPSLQKTFGTIHKRDTKLNKYDLM